MPSTIFFCILAIHAAARNSETTNLTWSCLEALHNNETDEKQYKLNYLRSKRRGMAAPHTNCCLITGEKEVLILLST